MFSSVITKINADLTEDEKKLFQTLENDLLNDNLAKKTRAKNALTKWSLGTGMGIVVRCSLKNSTLKHYFETNLEVQSIWKETLIKQKDCPDIVLLGKRPKETISLFQSYCAQYYLYLFNDSLAIDSPWHGDRKELLEMSCDLGSFSALRYRCNTSIKVLKRPVTDTTRGTQKIIITQILKDLDRLKNLYGACGYVFSGSVLNSLSDSLKITNDINNESKPLLEPDPIRAQVFAQQTTIDYLCAWLLQYNEYSNHLIEVLTKGEGLLSLLHDDYPCKSEFTSWESIYTHLKKSYNTDNFKMLIKMAESAISKQLREEKKIIIENKFSLAEQIRANTAAKLTTLKPKEVKILENIIEFIQIKPESRLYYSKAMSDKNNEWFAPPEFVFRFYLKNADYRNFLDDDSLPHVAQWKKDLKGEYPINYPIQSVDKTEEISVAKLHIIAYCIAHMDEEKSTDEEKQFYKQKACELGSSSMLMLRCDENLIKLKNSIEGNIYAIGEFLNDLRRIGNLFGTFGYLKAAQYLWILGNHIEENSENKNKNNNKISTALYKIAADYIYRAKILHENPDNHLNKKLLSDFTSNRKLRYFINEKDDFISIAETTLNGLNNDEISVNIFNSAIQSLASKLSPDILKIQHLNAMNKMYKSDETLTLI